MTSVVRAVIELAHDLQITVVAEGVETEDQLRKLHSLGCDLAQGYWLGHPMTAHDFAGLLG